MNLHVLTSSVALLFVACPAVLAEPPKGDLAILEQKLVGAWVGRGGCDGKLAVRSDGTYRLTEYGPGAATSAGTWKVRWSELPPALVLTCTKSELAEEVGTDLKMAVLELNARSLKVGYAEPDGAPSGEYVRAVK